MSRKFIASILAAALAITATTAAPARADGDDLARFLVGTTALLIIGSALADDNDHNNRNSSVTYDRGYGRPNHYDHQGSRRNRADLPPGCLIRANTHNGRKQVFGKLCLKEHYRQVRHLPRSCTTTFWDRDGQRRGYLAGCLRNHGYNVAWR